MKRFGFGVALGAGLAWTSLGAAESSPPQVVRPLEIRDAVLASSFHVQGRASISADGSTVAYAACDPRRARVDPHDKNAKFATRGSAYRSMGCDIWTVAVADGDGKSRNRTEQKGNSWGPAWSPDGRALVYFSDRGGRSLTGGKGSGPWAAAQTFVQNSPVYFLDRVETPLIIQAGASDSAIVPFSDEVFVGLKRLNKDVTYLRYGGEGHVLAADTNLIDYWKRVIAFLDARLQVGSVSAAAAASASKGGPP